MKHLKFTFVLLLMPLFIFSQEIPVQPRNNNSNNQSNQIGEGEWEECSSTAGNFWALMPGDVINKTETIKTAGGDIIMHMFLVDKGDVAYFIAYSDYSESIINSSTPQKLLDNARDGAFGKFSSKRIISENRDDINGYPAIMTYAKGTMQNMDVTFKGFQLIAGNRLYQVYILGVGTFDEVSADKFINSFVVDKSGWIPKLGDNGAFRFSMPGNSTFSSKPQKTAVGNVDFNMYILDEGNAAWFATYSDFPKEHTANSDAIELLNGSYNGITGKITSQKLYKKEFYKINGYNALKVDIEGDMMAGGSNVHIRYRGILALVENRLYQVYCMAVGDVYNKENVDYFEESFKLIKP